MPGHTPSGLLPTGRTAPGAPGAEVSTPPAIAAGPSRDGGRATAPHLSVVSPGLSRQVPAGARGAAPGEWSDFTSGPPMLQAMGSGAIDIGSVGDAPPVFAAGHVDAWGIWSPYIEQVVGQDHARILVNGTGYGAPYWFAVASRAALADPARADVRTPVQITPAVVSAEQSVSNAFTTSGLIPGHADFKIFPDPGFNDTVGGAS